MRIEWINCPKCGHRMQRDTAGKLRCEYCHDHNDTTYHIADTSKMVSSPIGNPKMANMQILHFLKNSMEIGRSNLSKDKIYLDVLHYETSYLSAEQARGLAAELVRLAEEVESDNSRDQLTAQNDSE